MRRDVTYTIFFLRQIGKQHNNLKTDLLNDFTTGDDWYPKNHQATLYFLDKYNKSEIVIQPIYREAAFSQKGSNMDQGKDNNPYDKKYWKTQKCIKCGKEDHPSSHYIEGNNKYDNKNSIEEVMKKIPELVDPVNQSIMIS